MSSIHLSFVLYSITIYKVKIHFLRCTRMKLRLYVPETCFSRSDILCCSTELLEEPSLPTVVGCCVVVGCVLLTNVVVLTELNDVAVERSAVVVLSSDEGIVMSDAVVECSVVVTSVLPVVVFINVSVVNVFVVVGMSEVVVKVDPAVVTSSVVVPLSGIVTFSVKADCVVLMYAV